jgi:hypothetical protein
MEKQHFKVGEANSSLDVSGVSSIYLSTKKGWNTPHITEIATRDTNGKSNVYVSESLSIYAPS